MRSRMRSPSHCANGRATESRPIRAAGSRRLRACSPSTACAVHADALTVEDTDWSQIVALYDHLLVVAPTQVVALNRAIAIGEVHGPAAALVLVDELDLESYY